MTKTKERRVLSAGEALDLQAIAEQLEQIAEGIRAHSAEGRDASKVGEKIEELSSLLPQLNLKAWGHEDGPTFAQRGR